LQHGVDEAGFAVKKSELPDVEKKKLKQRPNWRAIEELLLMKRRRLRSRATNAWIALNPTFPERLRTICSASKELYEL
jgi:hypothetical protein